MSTMHAPAPVAPARHDLRIPAILAALGGRFGWRFWWPLAIWLADALTVATFRPGADTEPAAVLILSSLAAAGVLWVWGARFAVALGHPRSTVFGTTAVASVAVGVVNQGLGAVARLIEVAAVGSDHARIFIASVGKGADHSEAFGFIEMMYILYGLPLLGVVILVAGWVLGRGVMGGVAGVVVGALGVVAYLAAWSALTSLLAFRQLTVGSALSLLLVVACCALSWLGFRRVAIT